MTKTELAPEEKAKSDALRLLAVRPRSVEELRSRLRLKNHQEAAIESVIELFKKQGLLDDEKFARLFAGSKTLSRPVGRKQLESDLKKKGVSGSVIRDTLSNLVDYDEKAEALKIARNHFRRVSGLTPEKKKARVFGFLQRRGFSSDTIFFVVEELLKEG